MAETFKLMSGMAVAAAFKRWLLPSWLALGKTVEVNWNPTTVMMERIMAGERADVIILIDEAVERLVDAGIVKRESVTPIVTSQMGLGVVAGAAKPDVSTLAAFKATLLEARSIAFSRDGASGIYFSSLIETLGIADEVRAKAIVIPAGFAAEKLLTGEADLAIQQVSELMFVEGVEIAGPFPDEVQIGIDFSVASFAQASNPNEAMKFIDHMTTRAADKAYRDAGLRSRLAFPRA